MTNGFELRNIPLLSRVGADRADALRTDVDAPEVDALELGDRLLYIRSAEAER